MTSLEKVAEVACSDKSKWCKSYYFLADCCSESRSVNDMSTSIEQALIKTLAACEFYSPALDESADISDNSQLAILLVRSAHKEIFVLEEMLDIC